MTKVMQGKDFLKLLERYLARATENVIHGVFFADVVEDFTDTDMVVQIVVFRELDDIVTGLEAYDAIFRKKYYIPAVLLLLALVASSETSSLFLTFVNSRNSKNIYV
ncbi:unnamed protein product [Peronospora farinosa]|uniref:Uncharacterized protein n=1 Tax=Peronospora farinosa TaxID=134698 RepID=A0AAV0UX96_9STRA|nr:unnamed protein product [Peronospora farinosa]CAI5739284.1 unnamed protein product [Peronospora farinosa]